MAETVIVKTYKEQEESERNLFKFILFAVVSIGVVLLISWALVKIGLFSSIGNSWYVSIGIYVIILALWKYRKRIFKKK